MVTTEAGPAVMSPVPCQPAAALCLPGWSRVALSLVTLPAECHFEPVVLAEPTAAFGTCGRVMMGKQCHDAFLKAQGERSWDAG